MTKAKSITPAKPQKSLFSFFQKSDKPAPATEEKKEEVTGEGNEESPKVALVTPSPSTVPNVMPQILSSQETPSASDTKESSPLKVSNAAKDEGDSDSDFSLRMKKRKLQASSTKAIPSKKATKKEDEEEWMESSSDDGDAEGDEDFAMSASDSEDSFIADEDEDEDYGKSKKSKPNTATAAKKPPLPKPAQSKAKAVVTPKYTMITEKTPSKSQLASPSPSLLSTPGYISSVQSTPQSTPMSASSPMMMTSTGENINLPEGVIGRGSHEHNSFPFLQPGQRKDLDGRKMDDPNFNPRTLLIPPKILADQTPAMAQWWYFKQRNMDTVLFFKVGKFYELFHMDADVGFSELDLIYMKGSKAHSGFPEISYGKYANILVSKGYRVARVEQTETPEMLKERNDSAMKGKKDKVVAREICALMSAGTRTYCHLDDTTLLDSTATNSNAISTSSILLSICEKIVVLENDEEVKEFGICCVDSILHNVILAQFQDDLQYTRLRTFLATYPPNEVVMVRDTLSAESIQVIKLFAGNSILLESIHTSEALSSNEILKLLHSYYGNEHNAKPMPILLDKVLQGLEDQSSELLVASIGSALWQLKRSLLDYEMFSMGKIYAYVPSDVDLEHTDKNVILDAVEVQPNVSDIPSLPSAASVATAQPKKYMILDEIAITNLELLVNNYNHTMTGSLLQFLHHTKTPFGSRLLKQWLLHPLFSVKDIEERRLAIEELLSWSDIDNIRSQLSKVPDLERLLTRIYSNSLNSHQNHPNTRAVMYEDHIYRSRQIKDFTDILSGNDVILQVVQKIVKDHKNTTLPSLLQKIIPTNASTVFPYEKMKELLTYFHSIFDLNQVKKDGYILPLPGINPEYDSAMEEIKEISQKLQDYLVEMKKQTGIKDMTYYHSNKDRYQLEIPMAYTNKVPANWSSKSQKKTHRRYITNTTEGLLAQLVIAEEKKEKSMKMTLYTLFKKFYSYEEVWKGSMECMAMLDVLLSFSKISSLPGYNWPKVLDKEESAGLPVLLIVQGRHPMLEQSLIQKGEGDFIPNDMHLGGVTKQLSSESKEMYSEYTPRVLLLTGPNMGGKSTLLRQTCLLCILAQLGCKVPAEEMIFTPVDRIFTRIGASDRILQGQSTFFVELAETAMILHHATEDSLCILDELGRGTATFDGTAVAHSVVHFLVNTKRCRSLFATHYHLLVQDWEIDPRVSLGHMDCLVEEDKDREEVTFLYKLATGSCPKSYGINVAKLAGLPQEVLDLAKERSLSLEASTVVNQKQHELNRQVRSVIEAFLSIYKHVGREVVSKEEMVYVAAELWKRYCNTKEFGQPMEV